MAMTGTSNALSGLPRRLVHDGIIDESVVHDAQDAAKKSKTAFVKHLINNNLASARDIAVAASHEFGTPLLDIAAFEIDMDVVRLVSEDLLNKHRVMPLVKRGKKLYVAVSDPTDLQALDEIKFQTGFSVDAIVVEEDKLEESVKTAMEQMDTSMTNFDDDFDLENLEISGGDEELGDDIARDDVDDAPVVRDVNKILLDAIKGGASDVHFEPS